MFYQFKPAKAGGRIRSGTRSAKSRVLIASLTGKACAFASRHPGIGKLILVLALSVVGAVIAGVLFYQGIFPAQPTIFKIDLSNTFLGERIAAPEGIARQRALDIYLDSLDKAITTDSIRNLETQKNKDDANAQLH